MQTVTMNGVRLVGTRTYEYNGFTAPDGREVAAGSKFFAFVVDPAELGSPAEITVDGSTYDALRSAGFGTEVDVVAQPYAKGKRIEWRASSVRLLDSGQILSAVS